MLNLILIDVQYSQKAVLALKKFRIVKVTPPQIPFTQEKNLPGRISDSPWIPNPYLYLENPDKTPFCL